MSPQYGPRCITLPAPHGGHDVKVVNVRDLTVGYDESTPDKLPVSVIVCMCVCRIFCSVFVVYICTVALAKYKHKS